MLIKAIDTGFGPAFLKAAVMLYPREKRLFEDPYAEKLLTPFDRFILFLMSSPKIFDFLIKYREKVNPGIVGWMFCRFRYIDDILINSIAKKEIESVVDLGAGMDCRAYYVPGAESLSYFEVDHPKVINKKRDKLKKILGKLPNHVAYVPIDFEKHSLDTELKKAGYNLNSKTLFIWEGVTQYISKEANDSILKYVAQVNTGSKIVFSYILKSFIDGTYLHDWMNTMYKRMCKKKNPLWIYGLNPSEINQYLSKYSLSLIEDVGSEELENRYMKLVNLDLRVKVFDIERIVFAEVNRA